MSNSFEVNSETVIGLSGAYGISDEDAHDLAVLQEVENHLNRRGDERRAVYGILEVLLNRLNRKIIAAGRVEEAITRENNY